VWGNMDVKLDTELKLSFYKELAHIDDAKQIKLAQHIESGKVFVIKELHIYDIEVYTFLAKHSLPGIPKIVELIEDNQILYVVEEYISGNTLQDLLEEKGPFSEHETLNCVNQLCNILDSIHQLTPHIVHRYFKQYNHIH